MAEACSALIESTMALVAGSSSAGAQEGASIALHYSRCPSGAARICIGDNYSEIVRMISGSSQTVIPNAVRNLLLSLLPRKSEKQIPHCVRNDSQLVSSCLNNYHRIDAPY